MKNAKKNPSIEKNGEIEKKEVETDNNNEKTKKNNGDDELRQWIYKYKKFCCDLINMLPYSSVRQWTAFVWGDIKGAVEGRDIKKNIIDYYVIAILDFIIRAIAFWPLMLYAVLVLGIFSIALLPLSVIGIIIGALALILFTMIAILLSTALFHAVAKLFGGKGSFTDTMSVSVLGASAVLILQIPLLLPYLVLIGYFIPCMNVFLTLPVLYGIYLMYRGIACVHGLSPKRAAATVLGTIIAGVVIAALLIAAVYFLYVFFILGSFGSSIIAGLLSQGSN